MNTWVTSDLHFGHQNIIKFCPRTRGKYSSVSEMNEGMLREWNSRVNTDDLTYILGDVTFQSISDTVKLLNRLNGRKILVAGNHDSTPLKHQVFRDCFESVHSYLELKVDGTTIVMFHYPISSWNKCGHGSVHLHGHCHGNTTGLEHLRCMDIGYDATGSVVSKLNEVVAKLLTKPLVRSHHA